MQTQTPSARGGMSINPFGSHQRLDKLDFSEMLQPNDPPEKAMLLASLTDAVNNYLFFGLGKNGTSALEFWFSVEYLFRVRASERATWEHARVMKTTYFNETAGRRMTTSQTLTDDQLRGGCLDYQWELLSFPMALDTFLDRLQKVRRSIVEENRAQILTYIETLQARSLGVFESGDTIPMNLLATDLETVLTRPTNPDDVADLVQYTRQRRCRSVTAVRSRCRQRNKSAARPEPLTAEELEGVETIRFFYAPVQGGLFSVEASVEEPVHPVFDRAVELSR